MDQLRAALNRASQYLERCDQTYAEHPTPHNNLLIIRAQRVYYRRYATYVRATQPPHVARVSIARALVTRAHTNRKRLPTNTLWQDLTLHQVRRAALVRTRAIALSDFEHPPEPPRERTRKPERLPRVHHPITGRMMYYDPHTDTYHRTYPTHAPLD
jgi:hypothetical protein